MGSVNTIRRWIGFLALIVLRGFLLWLLWPTALLVWLARSPWAALRRRRVRLRQVAGWLDLNLVAFLEAGLLRPFFIERQTFVPWSEAKDLTNYPNLLDMA